MNGLVGRTIQTLDSMMRSCVNDFKGNWDDYVLMINFDYNNSYHSSISMDPSPIRWFEVSEFSLIGSKEV